MSTYVQREGASTRTADELGEVFVLDVIDLVTASPDNGRFAVKVRTLRADLDALVWAEGYSRWLECEGDNIDQPEVLQDLVRDAEFLLDHIGLGVEWEDGYIIADSDDWDEDGNLTLTD